jgi:hypothetical protein
MAKAGGKPTRRTRPIFIGGEPVWFEPAPQWWLDEQKPRWWPQKQQTARKLSGKEWIAAELERSPELRALSITEAGRKLSERSNTAHDCAKLLSEGRCINLLRDVFDWPKKPRNSSKQRPK